MNQTRNRIRWRNFTGLAIAGSTLIAVIVMVLLALWCAGYSPWSVLATWSQGAMGNLLRFGMSAQEAGPLLLTGLAAAFAFRAGVWNIGAEGQFLIGAIVMMALGTLVPWPGPGWFWLPVLICCSALFASGWSLLAMGLEKWRGVPLVLSTILLNFVAVAVVGMLVEGPVHDPTTTAPQTAVLPDSLRLPVLLAGTRLHIGVLIAVLLGVALWMWLHRTVGGYEVRVIGANPDAARMAGMPVEQRRWQVMAWSGALAGLAGAFQVTGVTGMLSSTPTSYGYLGIAVAMLGRLHPGGVILAAIFMGMLSTGARQLERRLDIPHDVGVVVQGTLVLGILVAAAIFTLWSRRRLRGAP